MTEWFTQSPYGVRFEWGLAGTAALASSSSCLVIVDVLSFTTAVTVAVEAGTAVFPYAWRDESAAGFARQNHAQLAVGRRAVSAGSPWSLSPAALRRAPFTPRLVLPSPNGSAISSSAACGTATVVAACLRNAHAAGAWLNGRSLGTPDRPATVIAAGERWGDGSLRPALEDLLGAGAVIAAMHDHGSGPLSPEAEAARACYEAAADPARAVSDCASGRELAAAGFADDVAIATEINSSTVVPVLAGQAFTAAS
jgi:2-phosphosulfolactate phosphatase